MNESDARHVLLVRAFEAPLSPPWTQADVDGATREAARTAGESTPDDHYLATRARIASERLAQRDAAFARAAGAPGRGWIGALLVLLAFAAGMASDAIGTPGRINILSPPLLVLMAWSVIVYVALVLRPRAPGPLREAMLRWQERASGRGGPLGRFAIDWARCARPLLAARGAVLFHLAAAALVLGAIASMYLRGVAFEYRAGWESTFLDAGRVHAIVSTVLAPASRLTGIALPDVARVESLRAPGGENAARWIHLYAVTAALVVLLPRTLLALAGAWRAHRLASKFPLPLNDAYFRRLLNARAGRATPVHVVAYSYQLPGELMPGLQRALERHLGTPVAPTLAKSVAQGDEAAFDVPPPPAAVVALLALTATPERETHGLFLQTLAERSGGPSRVTVLLDESGFRLRFGSTRLAERREAWQRLLADLGQVPVFADLSD
jgi:hypothetical protein